MQFSTRDPGDGRALRYHFDEFLMHWVPALARTLAELPGFAAGLRHIRSRDLLLLYLEQALYVELLDVARSAFRSKLAAARGEAAQPVDAPPDLAGLLNGSLGGGVAVVPAPRHSLRRRYRSLRGWIRDLVHRRTEPYRDPPRGGGTIAVELVEGADLRQKCDAFWLAAGSIDPSRVIFVLEGINRALVEVEENLHAVHRLGSRVVAVDPFRSGAGRVPLWKPRALPDWSGELEQALRGARPGPERWLADALGALARRAGFWESFYREHGVQAVQQFTEPSAEIAAKRIAIDRVGGIEFGKMRSQFFEQSSSAFLFQHEVALVWHRSVEPILRRGGSRTRVLLETGYVYDFLQESLAGESAALRRQLRHPGIAVVAAVFDNHPHEFSHSSVADLRAFYGAILSLAARHDLLGLIIKSKKPEILALLPHEAERLAALRQAGRCTIVNKPLSSVLPTALAADVALGFPVSTAACEAALAGCRALMYDPSRASGHPWAGRELGIIFDSPDAFECACHEAIEQAANGRRGMARERLLEIDPFLDGKAVVRAAAFIEAFLSARDAGLGKDESIAAALGNCAGFAVELREH